MIHLLLLLLWSVIGTAQAHEPGLSYGEVGYDHVAITVDVDEFSDRFPTGDIDAASLLLVEHTIEATWVSVGGERCLVGRATVERVEEDGVRISAPIGCPEGPGEWRYHPTWLRGREAGHRHIVSAFGHSVGVLGPDELSIALEPDEPASVLVTVGQFVRLGVEHIVAGWDHLAFVIGLLLVVKAWREAALIVTGFTLAHSVTLTLSTLGLVRLSPDLVEPLIALSVAWVGVENLWEPPVWRRVGLTFAMGLIHGFGFAGALGELGLPWGQAGVALVSFNLGVELGQLAVVAVVLPLVLWRREDERWQRFGVRGGSVLIALLGLGWFGLRILG